MLHFVLPESTQKRLSFYLAMEEYIPQVLKDYLMPGEIENEAFFLWQVQPTVIFGRNQVMEAEVNIDYCKSKGIQLFRRKSGGGCVYADMGNIMISYITTSTDVTFTFDKFLQRIALVFRQMGLNAERSGRNDILINGKKVSGNAFFHKKDISIVHGTMLFDSDFDELTKAITPSEDKIKSKGVDSVRQHVTNIKEELIKTDNAKAKELTDIEKFKAFVIKSLRMSDKEIMLTEEQVKEIEKIEQSYLDPDFLAGRKHGYSMMRSGRIEGFGQISAEFDIEGDTINSLSLSGDYFTIKDGFEQEISTRLKGCRLNTDDAMKALDGFMIEEYVLNLSKKELVKTLFEKHNNI